MDYEAIKRNDDILREAEYDFSKLDKSLSGTTAACGSEFRPLHQLRRIFSQHPHFPFFEQVLREGIVAVLVSRKEKLMGFTDIFAEITVAR